MKNKNKIKEEGPVTIPGAEEKIVTTGPVKEIYTKKELEKLEELGQMQKKKLNADEMAIRIVKRTLKTLENVTYGK